MNKKYSEEDAKISKRYSSIKSRVGYKLDWSREDFIEWYKNEPQECHYCRTTHDDMVLFYNMQESKRSKTRGRTLEIDRKTDDKYSANNCVLCCYWCNNAKSDVFSYEEFINIGKAIGKTIKEKINH